MRLHRFRRKRPSRLHYRHRLKTRRPISHRRHRLPTTAVAMTSSRGGLFLAGRLRVTGTVRYIAVVHVRSAAYGGKILLAIDC